MKLAAGVSEALITTAAGLVIGIIALIFYSLFRGRVQKFIAELEAASTHLMAMLNAQMQRSTPGRHAPAGPAARPPGRPDAGAGQPARGDRPDLQGI